jgi:hypothetical protein
MKLTPPLSEFQSLSLSIFQRLFPERRRKLKSSSGEAQKGIFEQFRTEIVFTFVNLGFFEKNADVDIVTAVSIFINALATNGLLFHHHCHSLFNHGDCSSFSSNLSGLCWSGCECSSCGIDS